MGGAASAPGGAKPMAGLVTVCASTCDATQVVLASLLPVPQPCAQPPERSGTTAYGTILPLRWKVPW